MYYSVKTIEWEDLVERNKVFYEKFSETPFTGKVIGKNKGAFIDGKKIGYWIEFYD